MNTEQISYYVTAGSFGLVLILWFIFGWRFLIRKKPTSAPDTKRAPRSWAGLALQGVGFALVWTLRRVPFGSPLIDGQFAVNIVLQIVAVGMAGASIWLAVSAINELGKQWSLAARLTEGHKLITSGVYSIVRHPIYTAMFGIMVATGIIFSYWPVIPAAIVFFMIGTRIRTGLEEALLREAFGEEFIKWEAEVPGLIPFIK